MSDAAGCVVLALAGKEKGQLFCVVGEAPDRLLLCDGKRRRLANPKRKKARHVERLDHHQFDHPVMKKLQQGQKVSNRDIRALLWAFQAQARRV